MKNVKMILAVFCAMFAISFWLASPALAAPPALLDPLTIPKWVNQLEAPPPVYVPTAVTDDYGRVVRHEYTVDITEFYQQILPPGFPPTKVWGYGGYVKDALTGESLGYVRNSPGPSFESERGMPIQVKWINNIESPHMSPVDPTLHWADPNGFGMPMPPFLPYPPGYSEAQYPVPVVTHLHGGEVQSYSDGGPDAWFTRNGLHGPTYNTVVPTEPNAAVYYYPNMQLPTTLWYHDHALGITRLNVLSGLAGFYLLRDSADPVAPLLPSGKYEIPLVIQDRNFYANGSFYFPSDGANPHVHPYWQPEFFGNTIMVNGKVWPNMNVDRGVYRFRLLDGSNARFYTLTFVDQRTGKSLPFVQIGNDGGYLKAPARLTQLTLAPAERADVLVDFSRLPPGTRVLLRNTAKAPFPGGDSADPRTVGQVMQFTVTKDRGLKLGKLPSVLNPTLVDPYPTLPMPTRTRVLTLVEIMGMGEDHALSEVLLNGQKWMGDISELPVLGTTEDWVIANPTKDTHPIHLHLVQFQVVSRQKIDAQDYYEDWVALNGGMIPPFPLDYIPLELPVEPYLRGQPKPAPLNEQGWKDTVQVHPGEVAVIRVRFAAQDGSPYPFDATEGPGYVWHCHILEHEDNEMMRPYKVVMPSKLP